MQRPVISFAILGMLLLLGCPQQPECSTAGPVCSVGGVTYENECAAVAAKVQVAHTGPCEGQPPAGACTDSDSSHDIFTYGTCSMGEQSEEDACAGAQNVEECFCDGDVLATELYPCPEGFMCKGGACKEFECTDTDGGEKPLEAGTATDASRSIADKCKDEATVTEAYCDMDTAKAKEIGCPAGRHCADGACVEFGCTETDDGNDPVEAGTTTKGDISKDDVCLDPETLREYYCDDGAIASAEVECEDDGHCVDGACVALPDCLDSDGGKTKFTKGTVTAGRNSYEDECIDDNTLTEYYCVAGEVNSNQLICGYGYVCDEGACVEAECTMEEEDYDEETDYIFRTSSSIILYVGETIGLEDQYTLKLDEVLNESTIGIIVYEPDGDEECGEEIEAGDSTTDLCGSTDIELEIDEVSDGGSFMDIYADLDTNVKWLQKIEGRGTRMVETGDESCTEVTVIPDREYWWFYPRLEETSEGREIMMFGEKAEILEVDLADLQIKLETGGKEYTLEHGDDFTYGDKTYDVEMEYDDAGITKVEINDQ